MNILQAVQKIFLHAELLTKNSQLSEIVLPPFALLCSTTVMPVVNSVAERKLRNGLLKHLEKNLNGVFIC